MAALLDTNVVLYAFADQSDSLKSSRARDLISHLAANNELILSTQVLKEFSNTCTKKLRRYIPENVLVFRLQQLGAMPIVETSSQLIIAAVERHFRSQISFYDALMSKPRLPVARKLFIAKICRMACDSTPLWS